MTESKSKYDGVVGGIQELLKEAIEEQKAFEALDLTVMLVRNDEESLIGFRVTDTSTGCCLDYLYPMHLDIEQDAYSLFDASITAPVRSLILTHVAQALEKAGLNNA